MIKRFAAALGILGAASCAGPFLATPAGETLAPPEFAAQNARNIFGSHGIPVRNLSSDRRAADSGAFDAMKVFGARDISGIVECKEPKTRKADDSGKITLAVRASARERRFRSGTERVLIRGSVVQVHSWGDRADGARCSLTKEFAAQLLDEIVAVGGKPLGPGIRLAR